MNAESDALEMAVELVTGDDPEAEGYPRTPAKIAEGVAKSIGSALLPEAPDDGQGANVVPTATPTLPDMHMPEDNHVGSTWLEIVGASNTMKMRIATADDDTDPVDAASFAGMETSALTGSPDLGADGAFNDGKEYDGAYMDIPGTVFCAGDDCGTATDDEGTTLTGSWYFTPTEAMTRYVRNAADTGYMMETLYAKYGYWIAGTDAAPIINTYAMAGETNTNTTGLNLETVDTAEDATTLTDKSATYDGNAIGMSLVKAFDSQGGIVPGSLKTAEFTATVDLEANFGDLITLEGTVSNFQGNAVDSGWEVDLVRREIDNGAPTFNDGTTVASGQDGVWSATGFGPTGGRPTGFFGTFNAHFTNGHAAGAYATR
jgi:hypothetical protein